MNKTEDLRSILNEIAADESATTIRLSANLYALAAHLEAHLQPRFNGWSDTLRTYAIGIKSLDPAVINDFAARNRSSQGISDIGLFRDASKPKITSDEHQAAIAELDLLVGAIHQDCRKLENYVFNIRDDKGRFLCPCCGYSDSFLGASFDAHGGVIGTGICDCCMFEPGFDDDPAASGKTIRGSGSRYTAAAVADYHGQWRSEGMPWRGMPKRQPLGWSADFQIDHLRRTAPYLPGLRNADAEEVARRQAN
jgi:hypothetical protein